MAEKDTIRPTKKQRELLSFIESFINEHGYSPSYREIMNGLGYTSVATVALHVNSLIKRGHLRKREHSARSIEVVKGQNDIVAQISRANSTEVQHQWLAESIAEAFEAVEKRASANSQEVEELEILVKALHILNLPEVADGFSQRLAKIQEQKGVE